MSNNLSGVKHIILILSGKGGVGKSTCCVQLARALVKKGKKVGVLDIDLCGPSVPRIFGVNGQSVYQSSEGFVPVFVDQSQMLCVMSIGFLLGHQDDAVVWRGPKKNATIQQFVNDVAWGQLDYLLIDTPPGTSDEHMSVLEALKDKKPDGAILVTTPQAVSLGDVRRQVTFCRTTGVNISGIVENMSGYVCPNCSECTNIFSTGGGESLAKLVSVPFLGRVPIDPIISESMDKGENYFDNDSVDSQSKNAWLTIADQIDK